MDNRVAVITGSIQEVAPVAFTLAGFMNEYENTLLILFTGQTIYTDSLKNFLPQNFMKAVYNHPSGSCIIEADERFLTEKFLHFEKEYINALSAKFNVVIGIDRKFREYIKDIYRYRFILNESLDGFERIDFKPEGVYIDSSEVSFIEKLKFIARKILNTTAGLAIGSGAALGYAAIGVIKVLEEEKIDIDYVSGTSMGAIIGAFYSKGFKADEMKAIAESIDLRWIRKHIMSDVKIPPRGGFLKGNTLMEFLKKHIGNLDFRELKKQFACIATDIQTGEEVVIREGSVIEAVRASISLPVIFTTYRIGSRNFVDGGISNPVPADVLRKMGAGRVIAINFIQKPHLRGLKISAKRKTTPSMFEALLKSIYTMQYEVAVSKYQYADCVIEPLVHTFNWADFHRAKEIIEAGKKAAYDKVAQIKSIFKRAKV